MKTLFKKMLFGYVIGVAIVGVSSSVIISIADAFMPPDYWLTVSDVRVDDAAVGTAPKMIVDRVIHRRFVGEWVADIERKIGSSFFVVCSGSGKNTYSPDNVLPETLDLDWWTYPTKCNLPPGEYRVDTTWKIYPERISPRVQRKISNTFKVY